jgi:hypothetical protein
MYVGEATAKVHVCLLTTVTKITFHIPYMKEYSFFIDISPSPLMKCEYIVSYKRDLITKMDFKRKLKNRA